MSDFQLTRAGYKMVADTIMHYCTDELGMDTMVALPFVSNLTERLTPVIERLISATPQQSTSPDGSADDELQICRCGDYRRDHKNGTGACHQANDITHGFKQCRKFRLATPTSSPDKEQKETA